MDKLVNKVKESEGQTKGGGQKQRPRRGVSWGDASRQTVAQSHFGAAKGSVSPKPEPEDTGAEEGAPGKSPKSLKGLSKKVMAVQQVTGLRQLPVAQLPVRPRSGKLSPMLLKRLEKKGLLTDDLVEVLAGLKVWTSADVGRLSVDNLVEAGLTLGDSRKIVDEFGGEAAKEAGTFKVRPPPPRPPPPSVPRKQPSKQPPIVGGVGPPQAAKRASRSTPRPAKKAGSDDLAWIEKARAIRAERDRPGAPPQTHISKAGKSGTPRITTASNPHSDLADGWWNAWDSRQGTGMTDDQVQAELDFWIDADAPPPPPRTVERRDLRGGQLAPRAASPKVFRLFGRRSLSEGAVADLAKEEAEQPLPLQPNQRFHPPPPPPPPPLPPRGPGRGREVPGGRQASQVVDKVGRAPAVGQNSFLRRDLAKVGAAQRNGATLAPRPPPSPILRQGGLTDETGARAQPAHAPGAPAGQANPQANPQTGPPQRPPSKPFRRDLFDESPAQAGSAQAGGGGEAAGRQQVPSEELPEARRWMEDGRAKRSIGALGDALACFEAAEKGLRAHLGAHPGPHAGAAEAREFSTVGRELAQCLRLQGGVLRLLGRLDPEARETLRGAFRAQVRAAGEGNIGAANIVTELAVVLREVGDGKAALSAFQKALEIKQGVRGENHPDVAMALNNVATCLQGLGRHREALGFYERSLALKEQTLGATHQSVADSLFNLGSVKKRLGDLEGALDAFTRSAHVSAVALGPNHPYTLGAIEQMNEAKRRFKDQFPNALS
mmetsp:Transcript_63995/g.144375  ORF Transcript_63995/g.144375 Transcript_63995/m.144375 type:complete len:774 (-) Transcript_63995:227-2548(-)